jgi:hypothetical protein
MSMGTIERNTVRDALGIGIFCNDMSMCHIEENVVVGTRPDLSSSDRWRHGSAVLVAFHSDAELRDNVLEHNPRRVVVSSDSRIRAEG